MNGKLPSLVARVAAWVVLVSSSSSISLLSTGCAKNIEKEAHAGPADGRPQVTVAQVTQGTVTEFSEHTGHTESPSTVEIRARATGYLTRAAFHEGDLVKKGELLFEVDPKPYQASLNRARAELASARVDVELARKNAARGEQLFQASVISEQDWDTRSATFHQLEARTQVASAAVNSAELDLDYAYVRSPIAGRIGRFLVTPGNLVGPSLPTPLTTVVSVDPLYVYVDVDETRALRLGRTPGAVARVGFSGEEGFPHEATLDFVDNRVDPQTGTLKVRAVLKNPDGRWVHGLFARVQLPEETSHAAVLIADLAVATDQDRRFVWVVDADGKVEHRTLKLGPLNGGLRIVREGLTTEDRIVVRGLQRVRPGAMVAAQTISMADAAQLEKPATVKP
ncbi:MAG TPA: efflux RND transporter periplasmic adaptor subunit [Polyangiaceae bacterium]|nr:efflux RND transporter periplasmic adaptor subunit [Polyangiaceae bacterium]